MNNQAVPRVHWSFWLTCVILLVWNVMGCINFFMQMNPEVLAMYRANERALVESRPVWGMVSFAVAVFGGALGCLLLLLRRVLAYPVLLASLLGVIVTNLATLTSGIEFSTGEIAGLVASPLLVAGFLVWYAKKAEAKGWLRD